jgi:lycopene cyclase domain-containing protein
MSLYVWVILGTVAGPFLLSFDRKVHFYTTWRSLFPAILIVAALFLLWDSYFTKQGIWGFTPEYLQGIYLSNLPLEECLFFAVVPYACLFIYEVLKAYFPKLRPVGLSRIFAGCFTLAGLLLGIFYFDHWYTASACLISAVLTVVFWYWKKVAWYPQFVCTFLVALVPFLIVNGILTGSFTPQPVVWYSETHIVGPRIFTIPLEDLFYNYCMLLPIVALYEWFGRRKA